MKKIVRKQALLFSIISLFLFGLLVSGCGAAEAVFGTATFTPSNTPTASSTPTATATFTPTHTYTLTPTQTNTPTITPTPSITPTPTITPSPTFDFPDVTVTMNANCRWGPGLAYMHAITVYEGEHGLVHGRNHNGSWLYILPDSWEKRCWVSEVVVEVVGDIFTVVPYRSPLPYTTFIKAPENVQASRSDNLVTVTWNPVNVKPYDARGYLIEATLCQDGALYDTAVYTEDTSYTFTDFTNCSSTSGGKLYAGEKHGYTQPVTIPWP